MLLGFMSECDSKKRKVASDDDGHDDKERYDDDDDDGGGQCLWRLGGQRREDCVEIFSEIPRSSLRQEVRADPL